MSVIGFDVGNDNCVVAVAKQRGIDVLLNDESKRETPSVVSFGDKQRFLGAAGAASASMNPRSTISQIKRLVGRSFREALPDLRRLPFPTSDSRTGGILIHIRYLNEDRSFSPVQILAMLLSHLKQIAEKDLAVPVSDCVIGIPSYFTEPQRFAYLNAAAIAGLNPLRLMHDNAATALGYGIYKPNTSRHTLVVFVDIGHCDTQVSVVYFAGSQMRVISHAFDQNLGGRDFDEVLFEYFSKQFKERYQIDVSSNQRASVRLRVACEKLKKVLSANAEAPLSIECLMEEKDVKGFIKREEFESLSSDLLERVLVPCKKALADARLSIDRIHSVELVGSGSRIPAVMRTLAGFFRKEPSRTLNASECVARGCALQCAMLSPVFRVKDYEVQDSFPFSIAISFSTDEGPSGSMQDVMIFPRGQQIPSVKVLAFQRTDTFHLVIIYANQSELPPGADQQISSFMVGPFPVSHGQKPKVKVRVRLNLHGIVFIESASLIEDDMDDTLSRETCRSDVESVEPGLASGAHSDRRGTTDHGSFSQSKSGSAPVGRTRKAVASRRHDIQVSNMIYCGMTNAELTEAQEQEEKLANQDKLMEQTKDKRNALEAYVYEIRNKLFEIYRSFASDTEREGISSSLQQTEEWLYEEGDDETESIYAGKLEELKKLVDPIENRFKEEEARAQVTRELLNCIVDNRTLVESLTTYERDAVNNECSKAELWLREKLQQQESLPKNADPVLLSHDIKKRTEDLKMFCQNILTHKISPRAEDTRGAENSSNPDDMNVD